MIVIATLLVLLTLALYGCFAWYGVAAARAEEIRKLRHDLANAEFAARCAFEALERGK